MIGLLNPSFGNRCSNGGDTHSADMGGGSQSGGYHHGWNNDGQNNMWGHHTWNSDGNNCDN